MFGRLDSVMSLLIAPFQGLKEPVWRPAASEMVIIINARNRVLSLSKSAKGLIGYSKKDLEGKSIYRLLTGEDHDRLASTLNYVRRTGPVSIDAFNDNDSERCLRRVNLCVTTKDGDGLSCAVRVQVQKNKTIALLFHVLPPANVDDTKNDDVNGGQYGVETAGQPAQLHGTEASPQQNLSLTAKELADLSHEMKTPLTAILGFADAMREQTFGPLNNPRYEEYADHIHTSGEHLMDLVTAILDRARIDADQYRLQPKLSNLSQIARECTEMMRVQTDTVGLRLNIIEGELPDSLLDMQATRQILINLLSNAVKFTSDGSITVETRQDEHGHLIVTVRDTGIGMSKDQLAMLGSRFTKASCDGVRGAEGHGLGLSLAASLAKLHNGHLHLESAPGEGVVATLTLPFLEPAHANRHRQGHEKAHNWANANETCTSIANVPLDEKTRTYQGGLTPALKTQLDRIEDYREKINEKCDVSAA